MDLLAKLSKSWAAPALLAALTFFAALPGLVSIPALDRDESRFAQASRQMLETGDFVRIRYQDGLRNKKPAGIHWLQAGAVAVTASSATREIWPYRLPSLFGAMAASILTFWAGGPLIGRRAAFLGAAVFGMGILLTSEAHIAKTDAVLTACTIGALGALGRLHMQIERERLWALMAWAAVGFGFLIKGPVTLWIAALTLLTLTIVRRDIRWAGPLGWWPGPLLFILLVLPWFVGVQLATDGAFLDGAVGKDLKDKVAGASEGHGGPPGYHLVFLLTHFFPATLLLVPALVLAARTLRGRALDALGDPDRKGLIFLLAWAVPSWLFFEALPTKLSHYILPVYPALALVCGWGAVRLLDGAEVPRARYASAILFLTGAGLLLAVSSPLTPGYFVNGSLDDFAWAAPASVALLWEGTGKTQLGFWMAGLTFSVGAAVLYARRHLGPAFIVALAASFFIGWHIRALFLPAQTWLQASLAGRDAVTEVAADRSGPVQVVGYSEPSLVFALGTETRLVSSTDVALSSHHVWLINMEDEAGPPALNRLIGEAQAAGLCPLTSNPYYALNYSNGDPVSFIALSVTEAPC